MEKILVSGEKIWLASGGAALINEQLAINN